MHRSRRSSLTMTRLRDRRHRCRRAATPRWCALPTRVTPADQPRLPSFERTRAGLDPESGWRLQPSSVVALAEVLRRPDAGIVVPRIHGPDGSLQFSLRRNHGPPGAGSELHPNGVSLGDLQLAGDYDAPHVVDWATGAVLLIRRDCYPVVGDWDASFFMYSEEVDFCLRARDAGWRTWYEPSAVAEHIGQQSGFNESLHAMQIVNRVRLYRRRHGVLSSWVYWALALASEGCRVPFGSPIHRRAVEALLIPSRRPPELGCSRGVLPR